MTTFQDPPLQSRRAARQGERPESSATPFAPPQVPRTAAGAASAAGAGEPLSYVTQNRPPLPGYDGNPAARGRRSSDPVAESAPPVSAAYRPRDFSPEARTAPPAWAPEYDRDGTGAESASADSGVVDYRTQARSSVFPGAGASVAASLASEPLPAEETLSRRELRAIRDAHGITAVPTEANPVVPAQQAPAGWVQPPAAPLPAPQQPVAFQQPAPQQPAPQQPVVPAAFVPQQFAPTPAPSTQLDSAMAEFDALAGRVGSDDSRPPATPPRRGGRRASAEAAPEDGIGAFEAFVAQPEAAPQVQQQPVQQQPVHQQPVQQQPVHQQPVQQQPVYQQPVQPPQQAAPVSAPTTGERPVGHWTNQADIDDRVQVVESPISRTVGSGALTTSSLVLPSLPGQDMSTGEVMLTDSISLPSALAATGAHTPLDESDIDHLLDPGDHQLVNTDSVPIRAIRAVSSHSSSRNLINPQKPARGNRALTALIASASVMVLVVVTLLIVAIATDVL